MKNKLKNLFLESLNDRDESFIHLDSESVSSVDDVTFDKEAGYIRIDFTTTYGKKLTLIAELIKFYKWMKSNAKSDIKETSGNIFLAFVKAFVTTSKIIEKQLDEIIDDHGNIYGDGDKAPNNATNTMIGANHVWDLEKIMTRSMPKSIRNYSGNLGMGTIVW